MAGGKNPFVAARHTLDPITYWEAAMPTTEDVARDFTAMLRDGQFAAAGERFWADDVKSIEPANNTFGIPAIVEGIDAARIKFNTWLGASSINDLGIDGPFVTGNQFALFMDMVIVNRTRGGSQPFTEIAIYTVRDAKISEERYFYA